MIVKDGVSTLARCLTSVRGVVDRIVIGDTGSADDSVSIAKEFGAEIIFVPWQGDFSSARNAVLRQSKCDWILVMDADEMLDPDAAVALAKITQNPEIAAYDVWRWNYVLQTNSRSGEHGALTNPRKLKEASAYPAYVKSLNTRLFRRNPEVYFERPVHETVSYRLQCLRLPVDTAPFVIHHFGQAEDHEADRRRKNELYQQIGLEHLRHYPEDARTCFELGLGELEHYQRPEPALKLFLKAVQINPKDSNSLLFAGICLIRLQRLPEALQMLLRSAAIDPQSAVLHEALGDSHFHQGAYAEALLAYIKAQTLGSSSALVLAKRGVCEIYGGKNDSGILHLQEALHQEPDFPELFDLAATGAALARENRFAAEIAQKRLALPGASAFHYELASVLFRLASEIDVSHAVIAQGLAKFPDNPALLAQREVL